MEIDLAVAIFFQSRVLGVNNYSTSSQIYFHSFLHIANRCYQNVKDSPIFASGSGSELHSLLHNLLILSPSERSIIPDPVFILDWGTELEYLIKILKNIDPETIIEDAAKTGLYCDNSDDIDSDEFEKLTELEDIISLKFYDCNSAIETLNEYFSIKPHDSYAPDGTLHEEYFTDDILPWDFSMSDIKY